MLEMNQVKCTSAPLMEAILHSIASDASDAKSTPMAVLILDYARAVEQGHQPLRCSTAVANTDATPACMPGANKHTADEGLACYCAIHQVLCSKAAWEQAKNHEAVARAEVAAAPAGVHHLKGVLGKMEVFHCTAASATYTAARPDVLLDSPLAGSSLARCLTGTPPKLPEADEEDVDFQLVAGRTPQPPAPDTAADLITAASNGGSSHEPGLGQPLPHSSGCRGGEGGSSRRTMKMTTSTQTDWSSSSPAAEAGASGMQDGSSNLIPCRSRPEPRPAILGFDGVGSA
jgi:hypothetical protein